jgi:uncharacterized protein YciI
MAYFVCKLLPPRSTFPGDMTAEEGALMGAHMAYWAELAATGKAVVVGPVADRAGFWGLAVVEVEAEADVQAIVANDPVTRDGSGFRYEVHPMPQALLRESRPAAQ